MIFKYTSIEKKEEDPDGNVTYDILTSKGIVNKLKEFEIDVDIITKDFVINDDNNEMCFLIPSWCKDVNDGDHFDENDIDVAKVIQTILNDEHKSETMIVVSAYVCIEKVYNELNSVNVKEQDILPDGLMIHVNATGSKEAWSRVKDANIRDISKEL